MYKPCLFANYRVLTPLISRLSPHLAYKFLSTAGSLGKGLDTHTSYLFDFPAGPLGVEAVMKYLQADRRKARETVETFFRLETRLELENTWLSRKEERLLGQIIDPAGIGQVSGMIRDNGPMILLSGHTAYYFMLLWALKALGHKTAFMMVNPRSAVRNNAIMQRSLIRSADALSGIMPVIFTNEGGTVRKSVDLLKTGHTILMLLDVPGYRERGTRVRLFNSDFWIPAGCLRIREVTHSPVAPVFSYARGIDEPYRVYCSAVTRREEPVDLQQWADSLESVVRQSPGSWFGWFILKDML